jgi:hypothetical protein
MTKQLKHRVVYVTRITHYILYGLHELPSRNTAEDRCLDRIFLSFSRYATNCAIPIYILIILDLSRNIKRCCSKTGGELRCSGRVGSSCSTSGFVMLLLRQPSYRLYKFVCISFKVSCLLTLCNEKYMLRRP